MAELKKCPFYGGEAEIKTEHDHFSDSYESYVECKECKARTKSIDTTCSTRDSITGFNPLSHIRDLWNNRIIEREIRAKAIDEFAETLKEKYEEHNFDLCLRQNDYYSYSNSCMLFESYIDEIAEQLKAGEDNE